MTQVVFVGPSLAVHEVRRLHPDVLIYPPVRQGDIVSVLRAHRPSAIGLIDGVFLNVLSVWHKELLLALDDGVALYGAASMGALRAAECAPFGMVGLGRIYEAFATGGLSRDDEVAVAHATAEFGYRTLSEPLVNLRFNLDDAAVAGVIPSDLASALIDEAAGLYFPDRCWQRLLASSLMSDGQRAELKAYLRDHTIDHKADDARLLLRTMAAGATETATSPAPPPDASVTPWSLEETHYLQALVERDRWSHRQGEPISQEAIARHALVHDPRAPELVRQALVDLLALLAARQLGLEADGDEQAHYGARLLDEGGLATEDDLARFWNENDLTESEGERLLHDKATLEKAVEWLRLTRFKLGVVRPLLDTYRHQGEYSGWADAAAATQKHHGRGEDGLPPRVTLPKLSTAEQVARHSRESGWPVPRDLLQWSQKNGFQHPRAVLMEIERSRLAREQGVATRPSASGGDGGEERHEAGG